MQLVNSIISKTACKIQLILDEKVGNMAPSSKAAFAAGFASIAALNGAAHAQATDGFASAANSGAQQASSIADSAGTVFMAVGFMLAGLGGLNMYKRSQERDNGGQAQTSMLKILGPFVGGAALAGTGIWMNMGSQTLGVNESGYGTVPGG